MTNRARANREMLISNGTICEMKVQERYLYILILIFAEYQTSFLALVKLPCFLSHHTAIVSGISQVTGSKSMKTMILKKKLLFVFEQYRVSLKPIFP